MWFEGLSYNADFLARMRGKTVFFGGGGSFRMGRFYNFLSFICPTCAHPKRSRVDYLFTCREKPRTSGVNLYLVAVRFLSRSTHWCTWIICCSGVTLNGNSTLVTQVSPVHTEVTTDQHFLEHCSSIEAVWNFLTWISLDM